MRVVLLTSVFLAFACGQNNTEKKPSKRSYVCPPNFVRLSHRCYFFSDEKAPWQEAFFNCSDSHSNLAIVRNSNQDKLIRRTMSKKGLAPRERWLGGVYDWAQMTWKWGSSGKSITYNGFWQPQQEDKEKLRWHCVFADPKLQYKWNSDSCVQKKHYICQTKIKVVNSKGKKKLLKQYNVNKYNKLNEVPVPVLPEDAIYNTTNYKDHDMKLNDAGYATRPKQRKKMSKRNKKRQNKPNKNLNSTLNGDSVRYDALTERRRRQKSKDSKYSNDRIKWKTYFKEATLNPLHPKAIVEEFNYDKES